MSPASPPPLETIPEPLRTDLSQLLYRFEVRKAVTRLRIKWDIPNGGMSLDGKAADTPDLVELMIFRDFEKQLEEQGEDIHHYITEKIDELGSVSYWRWMDQHANYKDLINDIDMMTRALNLLDEWHEFFRYYTLFNEIDHLPNRKTDGMIHPQYQATRKYIVRNKSKSKPPFIEIRLSQPLTPKEWQALYDEIKTDLNDLTAWGNWKTSDIAFYSRACDLNRQMHNNEGIDSTTHILSILENEFPERLFDDEDPNASLRKQIERAKKFGL